MPPTCKYFHQDFFPTTYRFMISNTAQCRLEKWSFPFAKRYISIFNVDLCDVTIHIANSYWMRHWFSVTGNHRCRRHTVIAGTRRDPKDHFGDFLPLWSIIGNIWDSSQYKDGLSMYGISIIKIRRSWDRLIFIMWIPILARPLYGIPTWDMICCRNFRFIYISLSRELPFPAFVITWIGKMPGVLSTSHYSIIIFVVHILIPTSWKDYHHPFKWWYQPIMWFWFINCVVCRCHFSLLHDWPGDLA